MYHMTRHHKKISIETKYNEQADLFYCTDRMNILNSIFFYAIGIDIANATVLGLAAENIRIFITRNYVKHCFFFSLSFVSYIICTSE